MLCITVKNRQQQSTFVHEHGPLEFGRAPAEGVERFVINDRYVSRNQLKIESTEGERLRLENLGAPISLPDGRTLETDATLTVDLPVRLTVGYTEIEVSLSEPTELDRSLQTISRPLGARDEAPLGRSSALATLDQSPDPATLTRWFETLLSVQRSAAGSDEFYQETAQAVVDLVGLDRGLVLLYDDKQWRERASYTRDPRLDTGFSRSVLGHVLAQQRTFFQTPDESTFAASLQMVEAVVASPIFAPGGEVVGVVYGSRDVRSATGRQGIQPMEAQLTQLLAGAVSVGLARMEREQEAARMRAQFEQFVSPELARELERNPTLLEGREREITVLFSDLRGFSRIAERLGPRETYQLVSDVMDRLTSRVLDQRGVIIDYYGDGMAAMWNAPTDQPEHSALACRAALEMQAEMPHLNARWQPLVGTPLRIGIGISTGPALVGNAGSQRRIKYGPRGHTVNLASRVEGATKQLGVPILLSQRTRSSIQDPFVTRKICSVRAVGIDRPVELYELHGTTAEPSWHQWRDRYERALELFESRKCREAHELLQQMLQDPMGESDCPTQLLAEKASAQAERPEEFDPVFHLGSK